ncbi:MAG: membrane protein insertion efficiency factor YidD [Pseudomonadota bacterium]
MRKHGPWAGFWLALGRVSSCHPWGGHGYDGVPDEVPEKVWLFWRQRHGDQS